MLHLSNNFIEMREILESKINPLQISVDIRYLHIGRRKKNNAPKRNRYLAVILYLM